MVPSRSNWSTCCSCMPPPSRHKKIKDPTALHAETPYDEKLVMLDLFRGCDGQQPSPTKKKLVSGGAFALFPRKKHTSLQDRPHLGKRYHHRRGIKNLCRFGEGLTQFAYQTHGLPLCRKPKCQFRAVRALE